MNNQTPSFPSLGSEPLGLYPIVDEIAQLKKLLPLGLKIIQLRIKDTSYSVLEDQIQQSIQLANNYSTKLIINDYWELATRYGAYGIHLGQSDLDHAPIDNLRKVGLRLGISTHSHTELMRALALKPSYVAYGPIFATNSKVMSFKPQGIAKLQRVRSLVQCPLIAIGGIGLKQLPDVLATKIDGIAVISAISQATDPIQATTKLMNIINNYVFNQ